VIGGQSFDRHNTQRLLWGTKVLEIQMKTHLACKNNQLQTNNSNRIQQCKDK
jgi:hypothetical protein